MNSKVSVVIPNYNGEELLKIFLPFVLRAQQNSINNIVEVIVVDDASTDGSLKLLEGKFPTVKVIKHKINKRFGETVNTGFSKAKGDLVALLNSDVKPYADFLRTVTLHFDDSEVFGVSLAEKGYSWAEGRFENGFVEHKSGKYSEKPHKSFWVSGGSGVFRKSMWLKLKGFDPMYSPFYWEDLDISYRAMKRGWKLLWDPKAKVVHEHESTNKPLFDDKYRTRIQERNQLLFIWKNVTSARLRRKHFGGIFKRIFRHPGYIRIVLMALGKWRMARRGKVIEKRQEKVSDESIFASF